jgi:hypothetical protein
MNGLPLPDLVDGQIPWIPFVCIMLFLLAHTPVEGQFRHDRLLEALHGPQPERVLEDLL